MPTCTLMKYVRVFHPTGRSAVPICSRQIGHCCVIDGVLSAADERVRFHPAFLTDAALTRVQQQTRRRVVKLFQRRGLLPVEAVATFRAVAWPSVPHGNAPSAFPYTGQPWLRPTEPYRGDCRLTHW